MDYQRLQNRLSSLRILAAQVSDVAIREHMTEIIGVMLTDLNEAGMASRTVRDVPPGGNLNIYAGASANG